MKLWLCTFTASKKYLKSTIILWYAYREEIHSHNCQHISKFSAYTCNTKGVTIIDEI